MSDEPSPRPWHAVDYAKCPGLADVFDASGSPSGLVAGELKPADAALIVDAVNEHDELKADNLALANGVIENRDRARRLMYERDRLRDIVRRLLMLRRGDIAVPMDTEKQILADARAAIVEETK